ncbi:MAG TPA: DUF2330 domain-containing protein [Labilithrix sp.]
MKTAAALLAAAALVSWSAPSHACACAPPENKPVVNADQTVVIVWDPSSKTEHFVRRASFKADADDFGFLVPTPQKPDLDESGDDAFPIFAKITAPEIVKKPRPSAGCGCPFMRSKGIEATAAAPKSVEVLEEKTVAGFHASVLEATSASALVAWLEDHGYAFSPEIEAWAKPYVDQGWKITALKVAKDAAAKQDAHVAAASLRMTFKTERPLFPYREPDPTKIAPAVGATGRLLRIFFVSDARYGGETSKDLAWTGTAAWSGKVKPEDRERALAALKLAPASTPSDWWLTEFEDPWPYRNNPADLYFAKSGDQSTLKRPPMVEYTLRDDDDRGASFALSLAGVVALVRRRRARPC